MSALLKALLIVFFALTLVTFGGASYFYYFEPPFLSYPSQPFVVDEPVYPGDTLAFHVTRCNRDPTTRLVVISQALINSQTGERTVLPPALSSVEPGCATLKSAIHTIPKNTKPGNYFVAGYSEAQGTIRTFIVYWYSETFDVVPRPDQQSAPDDGPSDQVRTQ